MVYCYKGVTFKFRELIGMKIENEWDNIKAYWIAWGAGIF
jgi:hypothetical protein